MNGIKNKRYKFKRYFSISKGRWFIYEPDYFSSYKGGLVFEHVYFFQEYHKCCILPWGVVHHKNFDKENNMIWNLEGMMNKNHSSLHVTKDKSKRKCKKCNSNKTYVTKKGYHNWYGNKINGFICYDC